MMHPDVEVRVGAHQIFSVLLIPCSNRPQHEVAPLQSGFVYQSRKGSSDTASIASITARLEKLRREKDGPKTENQETGARDDFIDRDIAEEDWKQGLTLKSSPNFYKISSIIDKTAGSSLTDPVRSFIISKNRQHLWFIFFACCTNAVYFLIDTGTIHNEV